MDNLNSNKMINSSNIITNEDDNTMYIINNDPNENGNFMGDVAFVNEENGSFIQVQNDSGMNFGEIINPENQMIFCDDEGNAYIIDQSAIEGTSTDPMIHQTINDTPSNQIHYQCPSCQQYYQNANAFTKHMREKHYVKVFTCRQCPEFFETLSTLFLHARRTHCDPKKPRKDPSQYKFHCAECGYMTNNGGTMEHHRRAHTGDKPFQCDICHKRFAQKANMKTHRNRHIHKDRKFTCEICSKSFNSHDIYLAHLRTREHELQEHFQITDSKSSQIKCLGCNEIFKSHFQINKHSRSCEILKSLDAKYRCLDCELNFKNPTDLKKHIKSHLTSNRTIICPVCGERGFPGFNQLNHHITRAHALKVNRRNVCRYCEGTFEAKQDLENHINEMHANEKNARQSRGAAGRYLCQIEDCDFTSNSVMLMDRHHNQHLTNTLPIKKTTRGRSRTKKEPVVVEQIADMEMETTSSHFESMSSLADKETDFNATDVLRYNGFNVSSPEVENEDTSLVQMALDIADNQERCKRERKVPKRFQDYEFPEMKAEMDNEL